MPQRVQNDHQQFGGKALKPSYDPDEAASIYRDGRTRQGEHWYSEDEVKKAEYEFKKEEVTKPPFQRHWVATTTYHRDGRVEQNGFWYSDRERAPVNGANGGKRYNTFPSDAPDAGTVMITTADRGMRCFNCGDNNVLNRWMLGCTTAGVLLTCVGVVVAILALVAYMHAEVLPNSNSKGS